VLTTALPLQLKLIQQNPQLAQSLLSGDPRMIDVLGALMQIDMQGFSRPEGSDEVPPGAAYSPPSSPPPSATRAPPPASASSSKAPEPADVKMAEAEEEVEEVDSEEAAAKAAAANEKKLGAEAYKKRDFATAVTHFSKAWETWPKDMTFLTNLGGGFYLQFRFVGEAEPFAAAYFEQGEYDKSIETCQKAVDEGRDVSPSYLPKLAELMLPTCLAPRRLQAHRKSVWPDWLSLRQKGRPGRGDPLLRKVSHGAPHTRYPQQAQGNRAHQSRRGPCRIHRPSAVRRSSRGGKPALQGGRLCRCSEELYGEHQARPE
jgi:tetratricopeptide (TPR) repeat protein